MQTSYIIDDYHQSVEHHKQKIIFNLAGLDNYEKQHRSLFKNKEELIDSIKIMYKKCESDSLILDKKIEQTMRFFKPMPLDEEHNRLDDSHKLYCRTLMFSNGRQKSQKSEIWDLLHVISNDAITNLDSSLPYEIKLMEISDTDEQTINDCTSMISEIKLQLFLKYWCLSIVLAKQWGSTNNHSNKLLDISERHQSKSLNIHKLKEIKAKLLNSEFTSDNFVNNVPYEYADTVRIQLEFNGDTIYFANCYIANAIKLLENSLIDTCRISPQDIYSKAATILKIPNEVKYKSGEFGIKQLTSRVITLDHDILHKELIPDFKDYAVSEKTDGTTSVVMISGKDLFITCGTIVYKFEVSVFPTLPAAKNIEILKLNKADLNNIWIFDAEVIVGTDGNITLIPFDIRMASSINVDNINFKYRLMFINGLADLKTPKVQIKIKKWYKASDIKLLYQQKRSKSDGFIFSYLESRNFTISMYYSNKIWKWKPAVDEGTDNNTIDFLIQRCPDTLKGKFPYILGGKNLYVLCCGLSKAVHQSLPNIIVVQSLIPNSAGEYIPSLFTPSDKPYSHLFWSDKNDLHGEIGEFIYHKTTNEWKLIKLRNDRRIEVERGNYFGNDHRTAENNWFMMNNPLTLNELTSTQKSYTNSLNAKSKFLHAVYDSLIKHVLVNNETVINISPVTIMESFNKFPSVVYVYKNKIEANRYIKDKYELTKKKIRFNSYYVLVENINDVKTEIKNSSIPISNNGFDNLVMVYHNFETCDVPGFGSLVDGMKTVKVYENLINRNGRIIIVLQETITTSSVIKSFEASGFRKAFDTPINKWVYITDVNLYDSTRVLVFTRAAPTELINFVIPS